MKKAASALILLGLLGAGLWGITAQKWIVRTSEDLLKGKCQGVSISSEGSLVLAPKQESVEGPAEEFYLSLLSAPDGALFLGTGHSGKVFKLPKGGKPELFFQAGELDVTSLALDRNGVLYAATSPNGKIYKVKDKGKGEVFFDPSEKYIWALLVLPEGNLLAAVGEAGGIYEISAQGDGRQILKVPENHILCLKRDKDGVLYAGSGGNGLLYRIAKTGKASVLFESPFEEIKSLDLTGDGQVIVAATGTPTKGKKEDLALAGGTSGPEVEVTVTSAKPAASSASAAALLSIAVGGKEPSALYVVSTDGMAKRLWSSVDELIYAVLWRESEKQALIGTGGKGRIYAVDREEKSSLLVQQASEQVYSFLADDSRVYVLSNNPPHLDILLSEQRYDGDYTSSVLDAKMMSAWGRITWQSNLPQNTTLQLQTRSGNSAEPSLTWSEWSPPYQNKDGEQILSPKGRFLQFRALFKTDSGRTSPRLQKVTLYYQQANVAPVVNQVEILPPGDVFLKPPDSDDAIWGMSKSLPQGPVKQEDLLKALILAKKVERKGMQTIIWDADDDNSDQLDYSLYIKREEDKTWRNLEEGWTDTLYAFDSVSQPDGVYLFKVVASDAPSNPSGLALRSEKVSGLLTVDGTPPTIKNLAVVREKKGLRVSFLAEDNLSSIVEVGYEVRPGGWKMVLPADGICDSKQERFDFSLTLPTDTDNRISLMVKDGHGNVAVFSQNF